MPRIRIRTSEGERVVGTSNCSTLTVQLTSHAQRPAVELKAEALLKVGERVLQSWIWDFPEISNDATVELISEPGFLFDPPDKSVEFVELEEERRPTKADIDFEAATKEFEVLAQMLAKVSGKPVQTSINTNNPVELSSIECSFCGKSKDEVKKLIAGPSVAICNECNASVSEMMGSL